MITKFSYILLFLLIPLLIFSGCSSKKTKNSEGIIQISQEGDLSNMIFPAYKYRRMAPPQTAGNRGARGQLPFCVVHENEGESITNGEKVLDYFNLQKIQLSLFRLQVPAIYIQHFWTMSIISFRNRWLMDMGRI